MPTPPESLLGQVRNFLAGKIFGSLGVFLARAVSLACCKNRYLTLNMYIHVTCTQESFALLAVLTLKGTECVCLPFSWNRLGRSSSGSPLLAVSFGQFGSSMPLQSIGLALNSFGCSGPKRTLAFRWIPCWQWVPQSESQCLCSVSPRGLLHCSRDSQKHLHDLTLLWHLCHSGSCKSSLAEGLHRTSDEFMMSWNVPNGWNMHWHINNRWNTNDSWEDINNAPDVSLWDLIVRSHSLCSLKQSIGAEFGREAMEVATNEMISAALSDSANRATPRAHDCSFCFIKRCLGSWQVTLGNIEYSWMPLSLARKKTYLCICICLYIYWYVVANYATCVDSYIWAIFLIILGMCGTPYLSFRLCDFYKALLNCWLEVSTLALHFSAWQPTGTRDSLCMEHHQCKLLVTICIYLLDVASNYI